MGTRPSPGLCILLVVGCNAPRLKPAFVFESPWLRGDLPQFYNERAFKHDDLGPARHRPRARVAVMTRLPAGPPPVYTATPRPPGTINDYGPAALAGSQLAAPTPATRHGDRRDAIVDRARGQLGRRHRDSAALVRAVFLEAAQVDLFRWPGRPQVASPVKSIFLFALSREAVHYRPTPEPADIVFFHNTHDVNRDGRRNDWLSQVGVVETTERDGTVTVITARGGVGARVVMNLRRPSSAFDPVTRRQWNTELRRRGRADPPRLGTLSGQLFAGFGTLIR